MKEQILHERSASILLIEPRENRNIVIGAPHHTMGGVKNMPCPEHTNGDENTGFIARQLAEQLGARSIIACNYHIDPNKNLNTAYSGQIVTWKPKYLIEIHGHGARTIDDKKIEVSSGKMERNEISIRFATELKRRFKKHDTLKKYIVDGNFETIYFTARRSATITDDRWIPIHIELPPSLRIDLDNQLPPKAHDLIQCLQETIAEVCT